MDIPEKMAPAGAGLGQLGLGRCRRALAVQGPRVSWLKSAFEQYFLAKMRWGWAVPWFERLSLQGVGLSLIEPIGKPLGDLVSP